MENLKAAVETWLRAIKEISDNQDVKIVFGLNSTTTVQEWESRKTVPIQLLTKEQGVQVRKIG